MRDLRFDTKRLVCQPLGTGDIPAFSAIVSSDKWIRRFFEIASVSKFFDSLMSYECFPVIAFSGNTGAFVGYINGFVRCPGEMLVEYFVAKNYRRMGLARELLSAYLDECVKHGFKTFKFDVEDGNPASVSLLESMEATRCVFDDFTYETDRGKRVFFVYEINR